MNQPQLVIAVTGPGDTEGREWMIANGLAGYASGSLDGGARRRHDGLLVAAVAEFGRVVLLDNLDETITPAGGAPSGLFAALTQVRLEAGLPVWTFQGADFHLERRVIMPYGQNTSLIQYRLLEGSGPVTLSLRPWMHFRRNDWQADQTLYPATLALDEAGRLAVTQGPFPTLGLCVTGAQAQWSLDDERTQDRFYPVEADRGYTTNGPVWSPGTVRFAVDGEGCALVASCEPWAAALALAPAQAVAAETLRRQRLIAHAAPALRDGALAPLLVTAADAFLFDPRSRFDLVARAKAVGDEVKSVIAGYPWFNDWGRDTMISLEGLCLVTGRFQDAKWILRTFASYERDGLIPNNIPDGGTDGVYHAVDASLWFFHALDRYVRLSGDHETLDVLLPTVRRILDAHRAGTRFGIGMDPKDGLLRQGAEGYMLTWMDSATPRRGKPVEINALWYNALRVMAGWLAERGDEAGEAQAAAEAERAKASFNTRFWNEAAGCLFDVVDGEDGTNDATIRCNQILALSLPNPVLEERRRAPVLETVRAKLLTPYGLRSLAPQAPDYRPRYDGGQPTRDYAYHRGTVWSWLMGPFVDAWLRVHPGDNARARSFLTGMESHLREFCIGTIAEVFDADPPHRPRGCTAQAWSVAEWLRAWVKTA
jgi:glycogen debranching enzyme